MGRNAGKSDYTSVITGDVIASRNLPYPEKWINSLKDALSHFGKSPENWEIFRGDSFQLEIPEPDKSLSACLKLKAQLKARTNLNVRLGLGIGTKTYSSTRVTESNGDAFIRSGKVFDALNKVTMAIQSPWPEIDREMNLSIILALLTIDNWTVPSAEAVGLIMEPGFSTQQAVADHLNISQGSVSIRLQRAGYDELMKLNDRFEELIRSKVNETP